MTEPTTKPSIFISHASPDTWVAQQLDTHIRDCGADTFLDCEDIDHGDDFEEKIIQAATACTELLVLFTPVARERKYVWLEIGMFLVARKRVVAVLYGVRKDEIASDQLMPLALKRVDSVEINQVGSYLTQLKARVDDWRRSNG